MPAKKIKYADDRTMSVWDLTKMRIVPLAIGLIMGIILSFITSSFSEVLEKDIRIAYFIPFIVFMADAVGSQTQNIYIRDLKTKHASFHTYMIKETLTGIFLGLISSLVLAVVTTIWFHSTELTFVTSISTLIAIAIAPPISLITSSFFVQENSDPAVGVGPIATIIQDTLSVVIFGIIASYIIL